MGGGHCCCSSMFRLTNSELCTYLLRNAVCINTVRFVAYFTVCFHRPIFNCMQKQRITDQNWMIWNKAMSFLCPSNSHLNFLHPVFNAKVPPILIHSQTMNLIPSLVPRLLAHREPEYEANLILTLLRSAVCGSTLNCHRCSLNSLVLTNCTFSVWVYMAPTIWYVACRPLKVSLVRPH